MRYLFIAFLFISSFISGQGIEPTSLQPTQYQGGILRGVIPYVDEFTGETLYIYQHVDSLVFIKDSIYVRNDSIFLRDGTGFAIVTDSIYVVTGATKDTIKLRDGEGYVLITKGNITKVTGTSPIIITDTISTPNVTIQNASTSQTGALTSTDWNIFNGKIGGSGANTQAAYFNSVNTLTSNDQLRYTGGIWNMLGNFDLRQTSTNQTISLGSGAGNYPSNTGIDNVFIGRNSGRVNSTGTLNMAQGVNSLYSNTTGSQNVAIGTNAVFSNVSGDYNVGIGHQTLISVTGGNNVAIGGLSAFNIENSNNNVAIGYQALFATGGNSKDFNIAIGFRSLFGATGYNNTSIGSWSGYQAGNNNVNIGYSAGFSNTGSDKLYIENSNSETPLIGGDFATDKVGINTPIGSISRTLTVTGEARITDLTTDAPTRIVGADNDGDLGAVTVGNGLNLDGGSLTVTANINGTQNRVAKFTSQYAVGNSEIYTVGDTLVGINQSNPQYHLDVSGKFRVTQRTGTAATGAGFTSDGQLISYSLDTAEATPNTYIQSGSEINITGSGTMADPYTINNSAPENTSVKNSTHIDFSELSNDTITGTIIASSIGPTELSSSGVIAGSYTLMNATVDADGRITSASNGTAGTVTLVTGSTPIIITGSAGTTPNVTIQNAKAEGVTKGAATFAANDFNDDSNGSISIDYTNGQSASGSTKGFLTSTDWTTFNNKQNTISLTTTGSSGASTFNSGTGALNIPNYTLAGLGGMDRWGYVTPSGTGAGVTSYISDDQVITYLNGTGITIGRATGTNNVTITNTGVTSLNGLGGSMFLSTGNSGTYPNWSSSGTTLYYNLPSGSSGQVLKHNGIGWTAGTDNSGTQNLSFNTESFGDIYMDISGGVGVSFRQGTGIDLVRTASNVLTVNSTVVNTDNQTLSFSSPNLSISGGNSVALPVLPSGSTNQTLRHNGSAWVATSGMTVTSGNRVDINSWGGAVNLGSRLLVNGHIQYTNTGFQASTITGRDTDGGLTGVTLGNTVRMDAGTLNTDPRYALMYNATGFTASGTGTVNYITNDINNGITVSTASDYLQSQISGIYEVCIEVNADLTSDEYLYLNTNISGYGPEIRLETGSNQVRGTYRSCAIKALTTDTIYTYYDSNGANVSRISISMNKVN